MYNTANETTLNDAERITGVTDLYFLAFSLIIILDGSDNGSPVVIFSFHFSPMDSHSIKPSHMESFANHSASMICSCRKSYGTDAYVCEFWTAWVFQPRKGLRLTVMVVQD